jgi:hypothetical protein
VEPYNFAEKPVKMAELVCDGHQARRLLARFERFQRVVLDFQDVDLIGQAFADEVFRVFGQDHPEVTIHQINANERIQQMVSRVLSQKPR